MHSLSLCLQDKPTEKLNGSEPIDHFSAEDKTESQIREKLDGQTFHLTVSPQRMNDQIDPTLSHHFIKFSCRKNTHQGSSGEKTTAQPCEMKSIHPKWLGFAPGTEVGRLSSGARLHNYAVSRDSDWSMGYS